MRRQDVIRHFGSQTAVAQALGITVQAVNGWPDPIPPVAAKEISRLPEEIRGPLVFDKRIYKHSSPRTRRIAESLSA